jgi:hypothetical protein
MVKRICLAAAMSNVLLMANLAQAQVTQTITTDADAAVRIICRGDETEEECLTPRGALPHEDAAYVRVHDQNNLESGYWHFDLGSVSPNAQVTSARFQLDAQTNSWGDTSVSVVAIVDQAEDWDLDAVPEDSIIGENAPKADFLEWEPGDPDSNRFNSPTPFLDEGTAQSSAVRILNDTPIFIENQDANTEGTSPADPGNEYGGYGCCDGPATPGSADGGDNIWPTKNAVDIDITDLVQWKLGQNAGYSSFAASDRELTLMVRTEFPEAGGENGFVRFISKESNFLGGELDLAPGRIVITTTGGGVEGDFDGNGVLNALDIDALSAEVRAGTNQATFDLTGDGSVNDVDRVRWVEQLKRSYFGDANLDGEFSSADFVDVFTAGQYEDATAGNSGWATGDWNGDGDFGSSDFVTAFQAGGYELGPRQAISAVPEPSTGLLLLSGLLLLVRRRSR